MRNFKRVTDSKDVALWKVLGRVGSGREECEFVDWMVEIQENSG
jgi:hypothetical protein